MIYLRHVLFLRSLPPTTWLLWVVCVGLALVCSPDQSFLHESIKSVFLTTGISIALVQSAREEVLPDRFKLIPLIPYVALAAFSLITATWSSLLPAAFYATQWLVCATIVFLLANATRAAAVSWVQSAVIIGATLAAILGISQALVGTTIIAQAVPPASTFGNRNIAAEYMVCALPFFFIVRGRMATLRDRAALACALGLVLAYVIATACRSALLAAAVFLFVRAFFSKTEDGWRHVRIRQLRLIDWGPVVLIVLATVSIQNQTGNPAAPSVASKVTDITTDLTSGTGSLSRRIVLWKSTGAMILDSWPIGVGAGAWLVNIPRYTQNLNQLEPDAHAHNDLLELVAELGIVAVGVILAFIASLWFQARALIAQSTQPQTANILADLLAGQVAFLCLAMFGFPLQEPGTLALLALMIGMQAHYNHRPFLTVNLPRLAVLAVSKAAVFIAVPLAFAGLASEYALLKSTALLTQRPSAAIETALRVEVEELADFEVALNPHHRYALGDLAGVLYQDGEHRLAAKYLGVLIDSNPYLFPARCMRIRSLVQSGEVEAAAVLFTETVRLTSRNCSQNAP